MNSATTPLEEPYWSYLQYAARTVYEYSAGVHDDPRGPPGTIRQVCASCGVDTVMPHDHGTSALPH